MKYIITLLLLILLQGCAPMPYYGGYYRGYQTTVYPAWNQYSLREQVYPFYLTPMWNNFIHHHHH